MRTVLSLVAPLALAVAFSAHGAHAPSQFLRTTIDVGVLVSDIDASAEFYVRAIGFTETEGFEVSAEFATAAGLTDGQPLAVRVFVLGEGETATRLKLMEVPGVATKASDNAYVHSQFGYRYLTIFIDDANEALRRLRTGGFEPVTDGPIPIAGDPAGSYLTVVRDPDGNLIELIGPER